MLCTFHNKSLTVTLRFIQIFFQREKFGADNENLIKFNFSLIIMAEKIKKPLYKRWWAITLWIFLGTTLLINLFGDPDAVQKQAELT